MSDLTRRDSLIPIDAPQPAPTDAADLRTEIGTVLRQVEITESRATNAGFGREAAVTAEDWHERVTWLVSVLKRTRDAFEREHLAHLRAVAKGDSPSFASSDKNAAILLYAALCDFQNEPDCWCDAGEGAPAHSPACAFAQDVERSMRGQYAHLSLQTVKRSQAVPARVQSVDPAQGTGSATHTSIGASQASVKGDPR